MERGGVRPFLTIHFPRMRLSKSKHVFASLLVALLGSVFLMNPVGASSSVVIGEVAWSGSSLSSADEWIELWNVGDADVPLAAYTLLGASKEALAFPDDAVIPAGGTYVIANYSAEHDNSSLANEPNFVTTDVSLSNSALELVLLDDTGAEADHVGDGGAPAAGASSATKTAMVRTDTGWASATDSVGFKDGVLDLGTPGLCDGCQGAAEEPEPILDEEPTHNGGCPASTEESLDPPEEEGLETNPEENVENTEDSEEDGQDPITADPVVDDVSAPGNEEADVVENSATDPEENEETTAPEEEASPEATAPPQYELLRINEVVANPEDGTEWIELVSLDPSVTVPLDGLTLHDSGSKIYSFSEGELNETTPRFVAELSSARLNNSGDSVILKDPNGNELEIFTYEGSEKGTSWARVPDGTGDWTLTETITKGAMNAASQNTSPSTESETQNIEPESEESEAQTESATPVLNEEMSAIPPTIKTTSQASNAVTKPKTVASSAKKPTKKTSTTSRKKKTRSSKTSNTNTIHELSIDMAHDDSYAGLHVRLHGSVGSMPGLISGHGFILLSPTGRGIRVSVPTSMKLPELGSGVAVTGKLTYATNDLPYLKFLKDDAWSYEENATPLSRNINMLAPASEDAWSLVTIEGIVSDTTSKKIVMDVDGTEVTVYVKGMVQFRTARLSKGDTVQVTGLLEMTSDEVRILPRSADEISILEHAALSAITTEKPGLPGWVPFTAAGVAVVGNEGFKQVRDRRKKKSLERILTEKEPENV